jgi:AraC family transcriptional regulator of adaptative response/methylated-DNA-[protein]-cysteine methyltransferase
MIRIARAARAGYGDAMQAIDPSDDSTSTVARPIDPRLLRARALLDADDHSLADLAVAVGISPAHLQRRFRACFGVSPAAYRAQRRLESLRRSLKGGSDVSAALYDAGYGSPSRVYEQGAARLGMTPARYRAGGDGERIRWSAVDTALGRALIATTQRGICMVELCPVQAHGDALAALESKLRAEFPRAELQRVDAGSDEFLAPRVREVADALAGKRAQVPLDLIGTAFQKRVWDALMKIPRGQTRSYAEIADALGAPKSARAVASACAHNRVAIVVPCHRVIRGDGSLGGYRWGLPLKQLLLQRERAA